LKAKRTRAPAYSRALRRIKGVLIKGDLRSLPRSSNAIGPEHHVIAEGYKFVM